LLIKQQKHKALNYLLANKTARHAKVEIITKATSHNGKNDRANNMSAKYYTCQNKVMQ